MLPTPGPTDPSGTRRPLWLLAGLVGGPATTVTTVASAPGSPSPDPPATVAPAPDVPEAQRQIFDQLMAQTAQIRGLPWRSSLNLRVVSRPELARRVIEVNARDTDPDRLAAEEATFKLLGLIPSDVDYAQLIDDLLAGGVLGFYDPLTRELFVGGDEELDGATKATIVHEMTHALTDQHFNYGPEVLALEEADKVDELAAYSALLEGDASLTEAVWMEEHLDPLEALGALLGGGSTDGVEAILSAPEYVQNALYFPYTDGLEFVQGLHDAGGFAAVDAAYGRPPTSTEHIIHPATYSGSQGSASPSLPDLAAATGCQRVRSSGLGEFDMREVLDQHLGSDEAARAAQGWNGDAYALLRCGNSLGLVDRWEADAGADAGRLVDALGRWARAWSGGRAPTADGRFSGPSGSGRITRSGNRVDLVVTQDVETVDRIVGVLS
ncbi:MAG: hypothetical protein LC733_03980 [Actinobacteria bacterium]|nr:hypothetical protein [Actinomycetota bacterium]